MAITRQAYEWRGVVPTGTTVSKNGHPILGTWTAGSGLTYIRPSRFPLSRAVCLWTSCGVARETTSKPPQYQAEPVTIIDGLACWPTDANINVYVDDTYYFEAPDYSSINGLTGNMVPFPEPNADNVFTHEAFREGIYPPIIVDAGSTWGVFGTRTTITLLSPRRQIRRSPAPSSDTTSSTVPIT